MAYTGLLQLFLSPRAVSLLVCNTGEFGQRTVGESDEDQMEQDLRTLEKLRVGDWLRSLSFRIPDSDVIIVATKCDLVEGIAADMAGRMERVIRNMLSEWSRNGFTPVRVEDGVSLTSCVARAPGTQDRPVLETPTPKSFGPCDWRDGKCEHPPQGLLHRVIHNGKGAFRGVPLVLPRSWKIALEMLDALGSGRQVPGDVWSA